MGGIPGVMGREVYGRWEERGWEMRYPWGREPGEIGNTFCNIVELFPIEKSTQKPEPLRNGAGTRSIKYGKRFRPRPPPLFCPQILLEMKHEGSEIILQVTYK